MLTRLKTFVTNHASQRSLAAARYARRHVAAWPYAGNRLACPLCGGRFSTFLPFGPRNRPDAQCPRCHSVERHRLLWLYLQSRTDFFERPMKVLHFGALYCMQRVIERLVNVDYVTADLVDEAAMLRMDISDIRFDDATFDCVLSMHVLEHVPDDRKAMREILRVLKPGGWAVLQVPIIRDATFEDPAITTPADRLKHYGQSDHVRAYGPDFADRLAEAGFDVTVDPFLGELDERIVERYKLDMGTDRQEKIHYCVKPAKESS